jgi:hypothetical protein
MSKESLEAVEKLLMPSKRFIWFFLIWTILLAITASLFANVMSRYSLELIALFVAVILLILIFVFMKKRVQVNYQQLEKTKRYKGLIAFVSEPPKDFMKNNEAKEEWFNKCKNIIENFVSNGKTDSSPLDKISGIGPIFKAINHHSEVLSHCWLIHTDNSDINVKIIKYFTKIVFNDSIKPDFVRIPDPNNPKLINETIEEIYTNLPKDINAADIISDITSGTKPMTAGMIISCLNGYHKIEYVEQSEKADLIEIDLSPKIIVKF